MEWGPLKLSVYDHTKLIRRRLARNNSWWILKIKLQGKCVSGINSNFWTRQLLERRLRQIEFKLFVTEQFANSVRKGNHSLIYSGDEQRPFQKPWSGNGVTLFSNMKNRYSEVWIIKHGRSSETDSWTEEKIKGYKMTVTTYFWPFYKREHVFLSVVKVLNHLKLLPAILHVQE